jgi:hypothetical protein
VDSSDRFEDSRDMDAGGRGIEAEGRGSREDSRDSGERVAVFVIYDRAIDEEVLETLGRCCVERFTRWHDVSGVGVNGPHLGDHVWPALNNVTMTVVPREATEELLGQIRKLQERFPFTGLRAVVVPVLAMV